MVKRTQKEPIPHQRRKNHVSNHHKDDTYAGVHMVCERKAEVEKGEQDDLGT